MNPISLCLGTEEASHRDEQDRFNESHLAMSIYVPKRGRDLVDPRLEKSEPKGSCQLAAQMGHRAEVAAWQMVCFQSLWEERMNKRFLYSQSRWHEGER